ncbi:hypothetical protein CQW23_10057 [Capsicum baccatum]|uniref:Ubiquitin-like protease family profile domain-containing protein n=1 Tax=Capsicum baccatum TaxID=33114 RepID=A0A2G2WYM7_CAPBA|nr:hypothetical protein CQW23_10057 [Capsicum baccatum]
MEVTATTEDHNITVDNPSIAYKDEEKVESVSLGERKNYPFEGFNISDEAPKKLTQLINDYSERIVNGLLKHHASRNINQFYRYWFIQFLLEAHQSLSLDVAKETFRAVVSDTKAGLNIAYLSSFLDQKVRTDWSAIKAYRDKMANQFDVQYVDGIPQQTIGSIDCGPFVATYAEYLSNGLQESNDGLDAGLLSKRYVALLCKYGEVKAQKPYAADIKYPRRPKPNLVAPDEEQLVHID